jgi:hypothetical protein
MSGAGAPDTLEKVDGTGLSVVVVAGTWHEEITDGLIAGAERVLTESRCVVLDRARPWELSSCRW